MHYNRASVAVGLRSLDTGADKCSVIFACRQLWQTVAAGLGSARAHRRIRVGPQKPWGCAGDPGRQGTRAEGSSPLPSPPPVALQRSISTHCWGGQATVKSGSDYFGAVMSPVLIRRTMHFPIRYCILHITLGCRVLQTGWGRVRFHLTVI